MNCSQNSLGFFTFNHNPNYTQEVLGWFRFLNNLNFTQNSKGWFNFSNTSTGGWDNTQTIAWRIVNLSGVTILNLSTGGNISIAGTFFQNSAEPADVVFTMNNSLWLTESGDLHITGTNSPVGSPNWVVVNLSSVRVLRFLDGDIQISGTLFQNV